MTDFHKICPTGNTMDSVKKPEYRECPECEGEGEVGKVLFDSEVGKELCENCDGTGKIQK